MRKFIYLFVALVALFVVSCNKENVCPDKNYASTVSGQIFVQNGDVSLKSAPVGVNEVLYMYKKVGTSFALVDGTEFLAGSLPFTFWSTPGNNPGTFPVETGVYSNYTPAMPIRMVAKTVGADNKPMYLGLFDTTPTAASFPVTIYGKRLGDVLTVNTDALTRLPGYTNMSFDVVYTANVIDVDGTAITSPCTGVSTWPVYKYSGSSVVTTTLDASTSVGNRTVYDCTDIKVTGVITINIHVDGAVIALTTAAPEIGHGLAITLDTSKVGWYDSGTMSITHNDITIDAVAINVN